MTLSIDVADDGGEIGITDPIERRQVSLRFPSTVDPEPVDSDAFVYPVDRAVAVWTDAVTVENGAAALVLDESGEVHATVDTDSREEVGAGEYYLGVSNQVKTYLWVDAPREIEIDRDDKASTVEIDFGTEVEVRVGARSGHEHPEATITTTSAPEDVMTAVSYLGSALKDLGPMRSFPTLRGHPPEIELGDELDVPDELDKPETGITVEIPPAYEYVYPVAPLSYYLGAEVVPGDRPLLRTEEGFVYDLDGPGGFERTVERVLKQVFTCDCFARAGGPYSYELADREQFVSDTGIDPDAVYDRSIGEQVETYLDVPFEIIEPYVPEWGTAAHFENMPGSVEYLPFLVNDLAVIRSPAVQEITSSTSVIGEAEEALVDGEFTRSAATATSTPADPTIPPTPMGPDGPAVETAEDDGPALVSWPGSPPPVVAPEPLRAQEQLWIADGIPLGADRPALEAYRNALDRDPVDGEIEILVVCNDDRMAEEDEAVRELLNADTPFDVRIRPFRNLTTDELRELLERGADFLHYIGHIDERGFACPDGYLDAETLASVNVDAFFLNACRSYQQGRSLIDAGAITGVVTLEDVLNSDAVRTGRSVARLLNSGFPLNTALRLAGEAHEIGDQYTVVGDGGMQIAQAESNAYSVDVESAGGDAFEYCHREFVTPQFSLGSVYAPTVDGVEEWSLVGAETRARVSRDDLCEALAYEDVPVRIDGDFDWSTDAADRFSTLETYRSRLDELAELAIEFAGMDEGTERYEETRARVEDLREAIESFDDEFDSIDFRSAFRTVLSEDAA